MLIGVEDCVRRPGGHLVVGWLGFALGLGAVQRRALGGLAVPLEERLSCDAGLDHVGGLCRVDVQAGEWASVTAVALGPRERSGEVGPVLEKILGLLSGRCVVTAAAASPEDQRLVCVVCEAVLSVVGPDQDERAVLVLVDDVEAAARATVGVSVVAGAVRRARQWTDAPPNRLGPAAFAMDVAGRANDVGLVVREETGAQLVERGYGGLTAVNGASEDAAVLMRLDYCPPGSRALDPLVLVGKGVTFDSGGLSLKPPASLPDMKRDMAGAAAVAAVMLALPDLGVTFPVRAYLPIVENMPGGRAYRPGDVIHLFGGATVEVDTTDAEGRIVLAEALVTAYQEGAGDVVTVATLTSAGTLGRHVSGVMGDRRIVAELVRASELAGEFLWPMPLPRPVVEGLRSRIADLHQVVPGQQWDGPMIQGGAFLSHFVPFGRPWAHVDIAGQVSRPALASGGGTEATGVPVRTLLRLIRSRSGADADTLSPCSTTGASGDEG